MNMKRFGSNVTLESIKYGPSDITENLYGELKRVRDIVKGHNDSVFKGFDDGLIIRDSFMHVDEEEMFEKVYLGPGPKLIEELVVGRNQEHKVHKAYSRFVQYVIIKELDLFDYKLDQEGNYTGYTKEPTVTSLGLELGIKASTYKERLELIKGKLESLGEEGLTNIIENEEDVLHIAKLMYREYVSQIIIYLLHTYNEDKFLEEDWQGKIRIDSDFYDNYEKEKKSRYKMISGWINSIHPNKLK